MPTPELSIIIPTHRRPDKLARALASVAAACSRPHELIVLDDCADGSGFDAARRHGARYLCKAGIDRGPAHSRNLGMGLARGIQLAFIDDDDLFAPGALDRLLQAAAAGPALVFGDAEYFNGPQRQSLSLAGTTAEQLLVCNRIPVGCFMLPRAALQRRFDPQLRSHEDWEFLLAHSQVLPLRHVPGTVALIDKGDGEGRHDQARRNNRFAMDFLSIYARFPAPHLADLRARMLQGLGLAVPASMLADPVTAPAVLPHAA